MRTDRHDSPSIWESHQKFVDLVAKLLELALHLRAVLPQVLVLALQLLVPLHNLHMRCPVVGELLLETLAFCLPPNQRSRNGFA